MQEVTFSLAKDVGVALRWPFGVAEDKMQARKSVYIRSRNKEACVGDGDRGTMSFRLWAIKPSGHAPDLPSASRTHVTLGGLRLSHLKRPLGVPITCRPTISSRARRNLYHTRSSSKELGPRKSLYRGPLNSHFTPPNKLPQSVKWIVALARPSLSRSQLSAYSMIQQYSSSLPSPASDAIVARYSKVDNHFQFLTRGPSGSENNHSV